MATPSWQLETAIDAVVFDCDGTLSTIEGIDELAKLNGVYEIVRALTEEAMGKSGMHEKLYAERLQLVRPTYLEVQQLGKNYFQHRVPEVQNVIRLLKQLQKTIYIISAGLDIAVKQFGNLLNIAEENIFAVALFFDAAGNYLDFDRSSSLCHSLGKRQVIERLKQLHNHILFVGDGLNDLAVKDLVTRFVGFGGCYYRENIARQCDYYIRTLSMAPLLPLALTQNEQILLKNKDKELYNQGVIAIQTN